MALFTGAALASGVSAVSASAITSKLGQNPGKARWLPIQHIPPGHKGVKTFLGRLPKSPKVKGPGLRFMIPGAHSMYKIYIELDEQAYENQGVKTKDGLFFRAHVRVVFRISDIIKALFEAADYRTILAGDCQTLVGNAFQDCESGNIDLKQLSKRASELAEGATDRLGVQVVSIDITSIDPTVFADDVCSIGPRVSASLKAISSAKADGIHEVALLASALGAGRPTVTISPEKVVHDRTSVNGLTGSSTGNGAKTVSTLGANAAGSHANGTASA